MLNFLCVFFLLGKQKVLEEKATPNFDINAWVKIVVGAAFLFGFTSMIRKRNFDDDQEYEEILPEECAYYKSYFSTFLF